MDKQLCYLIQSRVTLFPLFQLISISATKTQSQPILFVYLLSDPRGWRVDPGRSARRLTGLRPRRWAHCLWARRRAGRRPPPLLSPPHPGTKLKAATAEGAAAAAAGGVQQRAWREGEQAQRHNEPRETNSGGEERSPAAVVLITKALPLSWFLEMMRREGGDNPAEKGWLVLRLGVWPKIVSYRKMYYSVEKKKYNTISCAFL